MNQKIHFLCRTMKHAGMHVSVLPMAFLLIFILLTGCTSQEKRRESYPQGNYQAVNIDFTKLSRQQKVYVPVYSDIYHLSGEKRFLLTITVAVRNTSLTDTIYVQKADYYDSNGKLLRTYLQNTIAIAPIASAEFVVEYLENQGGAGASFIVDWGSNHQTIQPLIQGVMIGTLSQQGISFITEGVVIQDRVDSVGR